MKADDPQKLNDAASSSSTSLAARLRASLSTAQLTGTVPWSVADALALLGEVSKLEARLRFAGECGAQLRRLPGGSTWVCRFDHPITGRPRFEAGATAQDALDAALLAKRRLIAAEINRPFNAAMRECTLEDLEQAK